MNFLDWVIVISYFALSLGIGLYFSKRASGSLSHFVLGGRSLPWYIAGLSMVATTFAADTPLAVTEMVMKNGVSGNWVWWNFAIGGLFTSVFFARLWRRSGVMTEAELITLRYSGREARFLRKFKAVYLGLFINVLIMGWVNLALMAILETFFNCTHMEAMWYTFGTLLFVAIYSAISGLLGVVYTDVVQFLIAMTGCIVLAYLTLQSDKIGGINGLMEKLPSSALSFLPDISTANKGGFATMGLSTFLAFCGMMWWSSWYPSNEPGGGGYIAQRMMSTKDEKNATFSTLFFQVLNLALRPWPWIMVALCCLVLYPDLLVSEYKNGYVMAMNDFLPEGLKGLMLVAFLGAYMSTIATHLNWGSGYLVNDLLLPAESTDKEIGSKTENTKKPVRLARITTLMLMILSVAVTQFMNTITGVWEFIMECGAGLGLVLMLRWYWWRVNAWAELTATAVPFVVYGILHFLLPALGYKALEFPDSFFITVSVTTVFWIAVMYLTKPTEENVLRKFCHQVKPLGRWNGMSEGANNNAQLPWMFAAWICALMFTYGSLFGVGYFLFDQTGNFIACLLTVLLGILGFRKAAAKAGLFSN